jgi:DNA replication protein DnaC
MDFPIPPAYDIVLPDRCFDLAALDRLEATIRAKSEEFAAMLDAEPQKKACELHGTPAILNREASLAAAKPVWTCPACESERLAKRHAKRIEAAGIPADVRHATLENFSTDRAGVKTDKGFVGPEKFLAAARNFAAGQVRNVGFAGTPGIGKGHLAAALAIEALKGGKSVAWIECARLFAAYHRAYKTDETEAVTDRYASASLIVLDEICLRDLPADGEEILFGILDRRHKAGRQTIFLGNAPADAIRKWLGSRIVDRLRSGGVSFCYGEWQSMRGGENDGAEF